MSSQIGNILKVSLFGESHGTAIGAVIDGFPPGVGIDMEKLLAFMARRAPGRDRTATPRRESDLNTRSSVSGRCYLRNAYRSGDRKCGSAFR